MTVNAKPSNHAYTSIKAANSTGNPNINAWETSRLNQSRPSQTGQATERPETAY